MGIDVITTRARALLVVSAVAAAAMVLAATALPWATSRNQATDVTTAFRGGPLSAALIVGAGATITLSVVRLARWAAVIDIMQMAVAVGSVVVCVGLALSKIAAANDFVSPGPTQTSYAIGAGLGLLAGWTMVVTSALSLAQRPGRNPADGSEPARPERA